MSEFTSAICVKTVQDDLGTYCRAGKVYEILEEVTNDEGVECFIIACELVYDEDYPEDGSVDSIQVAKDDTNFMFI